MALPRPVSMTWWRPFVSLVVGVEAMIEPLRNPRPWPEYGNIISHVAFSLADIPETVSAIDPAGSAQ